MSGLLRIKNRTEVLGKRVSATSAGYMELEGAKKDGDCKIVKVEGGISKDLGCCNLFKHKDGKPQQFKCGTCQFEI